MTSNVDKVLWLAYNVGILMKGDIIMGFSGLKDLSLELTIEYLHANPSIMQRSTDHIEDIANEVTGISKSFYEALKSTAEKGKWDFMN